MDASSEIVATTTAGSRPEGTAPELSQGNHLAAPNVNLVTINNAIECSVPNDLVCAEADPCTLDRGVAILPAMAEQTNFHPAPARFEDLPALLASALTSAIVSDSLDSVGFRSQVMAPEIAPLTTGSRVIGRARTIQFAPTETDPDDPYDAAMAFIDGLEPGSVAVIATGGDARTAYWGELFSASAKGHGAAGAICDGPSATWPRSAPLGFDVFAPGSRPIDFRGRMLRRLDGRDRPLRRRPRRPGDLVVADDDGVVVVPGTPWRPRCSPAPSRARPRSAPSWRSCSTAPACARCGNGGTSCERRGSVRSPAAAARRGRQRPDRDRRDRGRASGSWSRG